MAHVAEEPALQLGGLAQRFGALIELSVERDHAAIGFLQLTANLLELLVAGAQFADGAQQLAIGLPHFLFRGGKRRAGELLGDLRRIRGGKRRFRQFLREHDFGPASWRRLDDEPVHQPAGPDDPEAHPRGGLVAAGEDLIEVANSGALVRSPDDQRRTRTFIEQKLAAALARVPHGIAADLRGGRGDTRLVLRGEAEQAGQLARTLPRDDHVAFGHELDGRQRQWGRLHGSLMTTTVASSPLRRKSR